jgi:hypothetical protein
LDFVMNLVNGQSRARSERGAQRHGEGDPSRRTRNERAQFHLSIHFGLDHGALHLAPEPRRL